MKLLVSGATTTLQRYAGHECLGRLMTPQNGNTLQGLHRWATVGADNSMLSGVALDRLLTFWDQLAQAHPAGLRFVTAPDDAQKRPTGEIVVSWGGTLALWRVFGPKLAILGLPAAIVLQDGATGDTVPWDAVQAVFVGGTTSWKLSRQAHAIMAQARCRGKWVHVGRVNSLRRVTHFEQAADSFDGGQFSMFPDTYIPRYLERLRYRQESLWQL
jgi:hypothetical protein